MSTEFKLNLLSELKKFAVGFILDKILVHGQIIFLSAREKLQPNENVQKC